MLDPIRPEGFAPKPVSSHAHHSFLLRDWAASPRAERDLEEVFGSALNWPAAYKWLHSFRREDFTGLPPVRVLDSADMPGLWGGYSRDTREIFLSADCPAALVAAVLLEEIGHFLDHELCAEETPGDEGARFAALVLGEQPTHAQLADWSVEDILAPVHVSGREILVEAAPKVRGNAGRATSTTKPRTGSTSNSSPDTITSQDGNVVYTRKESVRLVQTKADQRVIGSRGNDTFVVMSQDARLEDPNGGTDTVEARVSFDLSRHSFIENLTAATGTAAVTLGGNSRANVITGNDGANKLDGGVDTARDTLAGGRGNDTYVIRDTLDAVVEAANAGTDTIETTINNFTLNFANVENVAFIGAGSATLTGNSLANVLTGGTLGDTLFGDARDTLAGSGGDDFYIVLSPSAVIRENLIDTVRGNDGNLQSVLGGNDTISTGLATYNMNLANNVEVLVYTGSQNSSLTGNSVDNIILGGNTVRNNINGGAGNDSIVGGRLTDSLVGGLGNDTLLVSRWSDSPVGALGTALEKGTGADILDGGAGADWYVVDSQTAYTFKETGNDRDTIASTTTFSLKYNTNISDNIENLYLLGKDSLRGTGSAKDNEITGNDGNNTLSAEAGNDTVYGGLGADRISGDAGNDTIYGGGLPQGDLPANASTAITMRSGEVYVGSIDARRDSDWIRVELEAGITYTFEIDFTANGTGVLADYSDAAFGQAGYDYTLDPLDIPFRPYVADSVISLSSTSAANFEKSESGHRFQHRNLVLDKAGARADGAIDYTYDYIPGNDSFFINKNENVQRFTFIPFTSGEFYVPISGAGPLGGRYTVKISDAQTAGYESKKTLSDDASNILIGGLGQDLLVAGNGRDTLGDPLGDSLFGGTNGIPGGIDVDLTAAINEIKTSQDYSSAFRDDTLIAATNNTLFARVGDTLLGAGGTNTILVVADEVIETPNNVIQLGNGQSYSEGNLLYIGFTVDPTDRNAKTNVAVNSGDSLVSGSQRDFTVVAEKFTGTNAQTQLANLKTQTTIIRQTELLRNGDTLVAASDNAFKSQVGDTLVSAIGGGFEYTVFVNPGDVINYPGGFFVLSADDDLLEGSLPPSGLGINYTAQTRGILASESLIGGSGRLVINGFNNKIVIHRIGADTLLGGEGNDLLDGGNGRDSMAGGLGNDTYYIDDLGSFLGQTSIRTAGDRVLEADNGGTDLAIINSSKNPFREDLSGSNFQKDLQDGLFNFDDPTQGLDSVTGWGFDVDLKNAIQNVEHASLMGSKNLYVLGNEDANSLFGNFGSNLLVGGDGDDSLDGKGGNDYLIGGNGGDWLDGGSGQNTMDGGGGSDTYIINDRDDRIIKEVEGLDGGEDLVRTYFNFDPIQGDGVKQFDPLVPDNSPSATKSQSFASTDLEIFYNLEHFVLLGQAAYGVGNALANSMTASDGTSARLLGMGGEDTLLGGNANDSLFGDTPRFYALPDLYAPAPTDTRTQEFVDKVVGQWGSDYLDGGDGNDYLDGGRSFDTMIGGRGSDTYLQDHVDDFIIATIEGGNNLDKDELITSVNIDQAPDGINDIMLVVKDQDRDSSRQSITGQEQVASFASFLGSKGGNQSLNNYSIGTVSVSVDKSNRLELMYSYNDGDIYRSNRTNATHRPLSVGIQEVDFNDNTKVAFELSWTAQPYDESGVVGYTVRYRQLTDEFGNPFFDKDGNPGIWKTYLDGTSQDFRGTQPSPKLLVDNLAPGSYEFEVVSNRLAMPVVRYFEESDLPLGANPLEFTIGQALREQVVTLQGGDGNDFITAQKLVYGLPGGLADDELTDPFVLNNPLNPLPAGFIFSPEPFKPNVSRQIAFAAYLDGGAGNDLLVAARANGGLGEDYEFQGISFSGLNTMVGGMGSDTFVVKNGGIALEDGGSALATPFDHVIKYGNETPVSFSGDGVGASLNGGQHNLIVSAVPVLVLSDTVVSQGKFIDQVVLSGAGQFAMGNRLDNFIGDGLNGGGGSDNTLVGSVGRDSIRGGAVPGDVLVGGTAFGVDNVGLAIRDFASKIDGGFELKTSKFRDTDPIPVAINGPAFADPSQFWFVPGYYGEVFDRKRNRDTLLAADGSTLDGGAGHDSLVGSGGSDHFYVSGSYEYLKNFSYILGGSESRNIEFQDAVFGNGGNDTVTFTDSDRLWWSGYSEGDLLPKNGYYLGSEMNAISNLVLQMGSPTARDGTGNRTSTGNAGNGGNRIVGNEFDNVLNGRGVGGDDQKGTGIDYLTGNGGSDNFLIDVFDGGYKNNNSYRESTSNVWEPAIRTIPSSGSTARHEWNPGLSKYQDFDYVVVTDFETIDNLTLAFPLSDYSIGNIPDQLDNPGGNVGPLGNQLTSKEFGIYYTGNTFASGDKQGLYKPNLVVVIRSNYNLLGPDDDGNGIPDALVARPFSASNAFTDSNVAPPLMGWGRFYELASSPFASYVNKPYNQADSFASLSTLIRSGNDSLEALNLSGDSLRGLGGNDTLVGKMGNDTLLGGIGADILFGNLGNDSLLGEDGDDYLDGGANNDVMIGGGGNDTFFVDSLSDIVTEDSNSGTDFVVASISNYTLANNIENLVLDGLAGSGSGNGLNNRLIGNSVNNTLYGLGGDDTLIGGGGTNTLDGGLGNDFYIVNSVIDTIEDIGGTMDTVVTSVSFDISNALVAGGTGIENLRLSSSNSANLSGNASDNLIVGNIGNDSIFGGNGNDTLRGTSELGAKEIDTLTGGGGADWFVLGDSGNLFYNALAERGDYVIITDFSQLQGDILQLTKGFQYLVSNAPLSTDPPIGASNSYLYRDNGNGTIGTEDNLIAAINATDGPITSLNNIAQFV